MKVTLHQELKKKLPNIININQSGPLRVIFLFLKKKSMETYGIACWIKSRFNNNFFHPNPQT